MLSGQGIPPDVVRVLSSHLEGGDVARLECSCKNWYEMLRSKDTDVWRACYTQRWPDHAVSVAADEDQSSIGADAWHAAYAAKHARVRRLFTKLTIGHEHRARAASGFFSLWGDVPTQRVPYDLWIADLRILLAAHVSLGDMRAFLLHKMTPSSALLALHLLRAKLAVYRGCARIMDARKWRCFSAAMGVKAGVATMRCDAETSAAIVAQTEREIAALSTLALNSEVAGRSVTVRRWELGTLLQQAGWRTEDRMLSTSFILAEAFNGTIDGITSNLIWKTLDRGCVNEVTKIHIDFD